MHVLTNLDRNQIADLLARDDFFWLDLTSPSEDELATLGEVLRLEDQAARMLEERAPLPRFDDSSEHHVLLIYFGVGGVELQFAPIMVRILISGSYIVTVHQERTRGPRGGRASIRRTPGA